MRPIFSVWCSLPSGSCHWSAAKVQYFKREREINRQHPADVIPTGCGSNPRVRNVRTLGRCLLCGIVILTILHRAGGAQPESRSLPGSARLAQLASIFLTKRHYNMGFYLISQVPQWRRDNAFERYFLNKAPLKHCNI